MPKAMLSGCLSNMSLRSFWSALCNQLTSYYQTDYQTDFGMNVAVIGIVKFLLQ